jgi:hypothetical protein
MADFLDMLRDFTGFTGKIEREMKQKAKAVQLPDEIDLYNFFEKWHGIADMSKIVNGITPYDYRTVHETVGDIVKYLNDYQDYNKVEYFIDDNCYHAIRFKDRGTFLVSERRYQELKAKKG